ncbi:GNAT family N-acetyltransferase [Rheinheimera riviphila]|uniref:GNAT family N-acetyltransferase n=1 Tax=Rheinheimera riviphila TaxID=1834037 RepID=A0A437QBS2_9GAMM|nr:GNAT family N-acetyltransferase [Rheinheimera riviphila]RVU31957.1 GNAT family N-acetyltransferase [Rheinheimera riviphila]
MRWFSFWVDCDCMTRSLNISVRSGAHYASNNGKLMQIRQATTSDAKVISNLIKGLALQFITPEFTAAATQHFLSSNNQAAIEGFFEQGFVYFVAESAGANGVELIGCIGMRNHSHLYHLFINEAWQGQGLARKLWQHAMSYCEDHGNPGSYTVNSSNNAVPVYQALGFVRTAPMQQMHGVLFNPMQWERK